MTFRTDTYAQWLRAQSDDTLTQTAVKQKTLLASNTLKPERRIALQLQQEAINTEIKSRETKRA